MSTEPLPENENVPLLRAHEVTRSFGCGATRVTALRGIDLDVTAGRIHAVRGRSGSGKTTLLNILGGLDLATSGSVAIEGTDLAGLSDRGRVLLRRTRIGFVFQSFGLIPYLSAEENVGMSLRLSRADPHGRDERVRHLLGVVGLAGHAEHRPAELSGGQQQRVSIARALARKPDLLIADEPTGHLDSRTGSGIARLLREIADTEGTAVVLSTHDRRLAEIADTVFDLRDGRVGEPAVAQVG
ncbi:ABC transporter ATP-binding protein [Actinospica durhamensis]|uniref:ABC transporter ATP-binding protein n=1 Tax=Actinospica durhamensis TaxID=1508375 RepID=A0A941ISK5_9ACTN|nr:ABC transporter ATP-binding protein [Actinospica durhamensis]MBR7836472.1 ABC transporter ATP-binding protein [Actinospica durhamensis]